jgi:hypothetical protein
MSRKLAKIAANSYLSSATHLVLLNYFLNLLISETSQIIRRTTCQLGVEKKKRQYILKKINYKDMIAEFISRNTRRMMLFGRS